LIHDLPDLAAIPVFSRPSRDAIPHLICEIAELGRIVGPHLEGGGLEPRLKLCPVLELTLPPLFAEHRLEIANPLRPLAPSGYFLAVPIPLQPVFEVIDDFCVLTGT
jgi:hypothetical protein